MFRAFPKLFFTFEEDEEQGVLKIEGLNDAKNEAQFLSIGVPYARRRFDGATGNVTWELFMDRNGNNPAKGFEFVGEDKEHFCAVFRYTGEKADASK